MEFTKKDFNINRVIGAVSYIIFSFFLALILSGLIGSVHPNGEFMSISMPTFWIIFIILVSLYVLVSFKYGNKNKNKSGDKSEKIGEIFEMIIEFAGGLGSVYFVPLALTTLTADYSLKAIIGIASIFLILSLAIFLKRKPFLYGVIAGAIMPLFIYVIELLDPGPWL